jgi:ABC-type xylose transport system permease subunit
MFALLTGGFDLSVGTTLAITSVVGATAMAAAHAAMPDAVALAVALGLLAGFGAGLSIGIVNGVGVALFNVSPFMMTLGMASIGFGIALYMTGGVPVYGMPPEFGTVFGFGSWLGIPAPVYFTVALVVLLYLLVNWTRIGRYFYAVGGNIKAARLSGINTRLTLFTAYVLCGGMASISGLLLTARLDGPSRIHHARKIVVFDLRTFGCILGLHARLGNDRHHRLSDVKHLAFGERRARRRGHGRAVGAFEKGRKRDVPYPVDTQVLHRPGRDHAFAFPGL